MKRLFVDCSFLVQNPQIRTGIQRVVRRLVEEMPAAVDAQSVQIIPVRLDTGRVLPINPELLKYEVSHSTPAAQAGAPGFPARLRSHLREYLAGVASASLNLFIMLLPTTGSRHKVMDSLRKIRNALRNLRINRSNPLRSVQAALAPASDNPAFQLNQQDCLLMLDSSWHIPVDEGVKLFRQAGAKVVYVVYDLIPVLYPQFCDNGLVPVFDRWLKNTSNFADGYLCISNAVKTDVQGYMKIHVPEQAARFAYGSFPLGCDFNAGRITSEANASAQYADPQLASMFAAAPTFLMVSTIEPRKNHRMVLDAFDQLWAQGVRVNLLIVGKVGWNVQHLMLRIKSHPQLNKQLFMLNNADDALVQHCYSNSTSLVFASYTEGFGLPIVEALAAGLPVIASDIPCHREVGRNLVQYFDLHQPRTLEQGILNLISTSADQRKTLPTAVQQSGVVHSWKQSAQHALQFCSAVVEGSQPA